MKISVGYRLSLLVIAEMVTASILVGGGLRTLNRFANEERYMYEFQFGPVVEISETIGHLRELESLVSGLVPEPKPGRTQELLAVISAFPAKYQHEWAVARSESPDSKRFYADLKAMNQLEIVEQEGKAQSAVEASLAQFMVKQASSALPESIPARVELRKATLILHQDLFRLLEINNRYAELGHQQVQAGLARDRWLALAFGIFGVLAAGFLGWNVRSAIFPRIQALVRKVKRFQTLGVNEKVFTNEQLGRDEIAILANAIDSGFSAIVERDRERERFLAVAAHELKTPVTSIQGFAQIAGARSTDPVVLTKALETIQRQSVRLGRLIDDLLWASQARSGNLTFSTAPLSLVEVIRRQIHEVEKLQLGHPIEFVLSTGEEGRLLGDAALLSHSFWTLMAYASSLAGNEEPIRIGVRSLDSQVQTRIQVPGRFVPNELQSQILAPFGSFQFEGNQGIRTAIGLYLCREIARIHGGTLTFEEERGTGTVILLSLPR